MQCPICKGTRFVSFRGRRKAQCVKCKSLERHREVFSTIESMVALGQISSILHFAPEKGLRRYLKTKVRYVAADLTPKDKYTVKANLLKLPFQDKEFDCAICIHVLEHIINVTQALTELRRVAYRSIIMVPIRNGPSYRNPDATTPEMKKLHHGQNNHEWWFGDDFDQLLKHVGFRVEVSGNVFLCS